MHDSILGWYFLLTCKNIRIIFQREQIILIVNESTECLSGFKLIVFNDHSITSNVHMNWDLPTG